mmetsp:Transcript_1932/g.8550  ORF Transcript_1932/g.8550 Transcript_1932/m.8550 type:complete len:212 (+) Transcript_1932:2867-3502(+)
MRSVSIMMRGRRERRLFLPLATSEDVHRLLHDGIPVVVPEVADGVEAHDSDVDHLQLAWENGHVEAKNCHEAEAHHVRQPQEGLQEPRKQIVQEERQRGIVEKDRALDRDAVAQHALVDEWVKEQLQQQESDEPGRHSLEVVLEEPDHDVSIDEAEQSDHEEQVKEQETKNRGAHRDAHVHRHPLHGEGLRLVQPRRARIPAAELSQLRYQ